MPWDGPNPDAYEPAVNWESILRGDNQPGSVKGKLIQMLDVGRSAESVGLDKIEARSAINAKFVPPSIYDQVYEVATAHNPVSG